jgi:hypothetical protein
MVTQKVQQTLTTLETLYLTLNFIKKPNEKQWNQLERLCTKERDRLLLDADALEDLDLVYPRKEAIMADFNHLTLYIHIRKQLMAM